MKATLAEIANIVQGVVVGDENIEISKLSPIDDIAPGSLIFAEGQDNFKTAEMSEAAAILVANNVSSTNKAIIQVANPFISFIKLLAYFYPAIKQAEGVHPSAVISDNVTLGTNIAIGANVVINSGTTIADGCVIKGNVHIGHHVSIGADTVIHPSVTIYDNSRIGSKVNIHAGAVIGSDGFGYTFNNGEHIKVPHVGHVTSRLARIP